MALPSSGQISFSDINTELDRSSTAQHSLKDGQTGVYDPINTTNSPANRPNGSTPHQISEWYSYDHDAAKPTISSFTGATHSSSTGFVTLSWSISDNGYAITSFNLYHTENQNSDPPGIAGSVISTSNDGSQNHNAGSGDTDYYAITVANTWGTTYSTLGGSWLAATGRAGGGGGCFLYGEQVLLPDGTTTNIEDLVVGQQVQSMSIPGMPVNTEYDDEYDAYKDFTIESLSSASLAPATVRSIDLDTFTGYFKITLANGTIIKVTHEHPVFVYRDGAYRWTQISKDSHVLLETDLLVDKDFNKQAISSIEFVEMSIQTATIDVEDLDVYFVNGHLFHNREGPGK